MTTKLQVNAKEVIRTMGRRLRNYFTKSSESLVSPRSATGGSILSVFLTSSRIECGVAGMLFVLFLLLLASSTAQGQSAAGWNKRGEKAELRQDYDLAYEAYKQAAQKSPKDIRYRTRYENMRFKAGAAHVDRGRTYLQGGDSGAALTEFTRALQIDPSNQTAQQEIDLIRNPKAAAPTVSPGQSGSQNETQKQIGAVTGIVELKPDVERSNHAAHGRRYEGDLPGDRQGRRAECTLRSGLHV